MPIDWSGMAHDVFVAESEAQAKERARRLAQLSGPKRGRKPKTAEEPEEYELDAEDEAAE